MYDFFYGVFQGIGWADGAANFVSYALMVLSIALICYLVHITAEFVVKKAAKKLTGQKHKWAGILFKHNFFHHLANALIPITITMMEFQLPSAKQAVNSLLIKGAGVIGAVVSVFLFGAFFKAANEIYNLHDISKVKPMHGLFQIMHVVVIIVSIVIGIAILAGQNPITLIGGIGAVAAIVSFIFKDAILGFISGLQLINDDLIRIGDWIEMPRHSANGTVVELFMTSVKVRNFDLSITSIPAYSLITDSFINWRDMQDSGSRRIKRAIYIDARYIRFLENNDSGKPDTNLGEFREYVMDYIKKHPCIRHDLAIVIRQLDSDTQGVPLEIYAFANTQEFAEYERIQSAIFEHLYAKIKEFGLYVYQQSSGISAPAATIERMENRP